MRIGGDLVTHGAQVTTYALEGGKVDQLQLGEQLLATGEGATAIAVGPGSSTPLAHVRAAAPAGTVLRQAGGTITDQTGFAQG